MLGLTELRCALVALAQHTRARIDPLPYGQYKCAERAPRHGAAPHARRLAPAHAASPHRLPSPAWAKALQHQRNFPRGLRS